MKLRTGLVLLAAGLLAGCGPNLPTVPPVSEEQRAQEMANNPHMPPEARQALQNMGQMQGGPGGAPAPTSPASAGPAPSPTGG